MTDVLREVFLLLLFSLPGHIDNVAGAELDWTACSGEVSVPSGTVFSSNYSQLHDCGNWSRVVSISDGYYMDLTVNSLHLGPHDFLAVSSGSRMVSTPATVILVGKLHTSRNLRAVRSNTAHLQFVTSSSIALNLEGFTVTFNADKPLTTTPKPTDPPSTLPTPGANISDTYTIYLSGRKAVDFLLYKAGLQTCIKEMAARYCEDNNIKTLQNITEQNVVFRYVERCDVTWPNSVDCTKVRLAVPIVVASGYQLTTSQIKDMWETYATQNSRLSQLGLQVYSVPDAQMSMFVWLSIVACITLAFSVVMLVIWKLLNRSRFTKHDSSSTNSQTRFSSSSKQSWIDDLPHQELPINAVGGIREYEPDIMHTRASMPSTPIGPRPHVPVPDSKPLPEYGATLLFGPGFDRQALMEEEEGPDTNNVSVS